jgi:uncharacterized protein (DUF2336 family)
MRLETESGLDITVLEAVLDCGQGEARQALARQLAALIADAATPDIERQQVVPILLKLATDLDRDVRVALADELSTVDHIHQDLIFAIIADEDAIALPFLATTPGLNSWHMQAILRVGDEARQRTVAGRPDLSEEAQSFIIRAGSAVAAATMLQNRRIKLKPQDYQTLFGRLGQSGDVVDRLLAREDLPLDIRITQAKRAAVRMRQMMAERGWMPANDANDLVADAEENAVLHVLQQASPVERAHGMQFLAAQNMLTPSLIVRAACLGETTVVAAALGHLAGQPQERVQSFMLTKGGAGIRSMLHRSMLPAACHAIIAASADVAAQAREEGVDLDADAFGRRLLENLMLQFGALGARDQAKLMDYVGRFADDKVRKIARKLKADVLRAA